MTTYYLFCHWYDRKFKNIVAGPMKLFELADNLKSMGNNVVLFTPKIGLPKQQTNVKVIEIPVIGIPVLGLIIYEILLLLASLYLLLSTKCDVVYVRIMTSFVPILVAKLSGCPLILEVNDDPALRYEMSNGLQNINNVLVRSCDSINYNFADRILPVTEKSKNSILSEHNIAAERFDIIQSGANTDLFVPLKKMESRRALNLDTGKRYVGFVGSYNPFHDYDSILNSAKAVISKFQDIRYLMVGNLSAVLLPKIEKLGLKDYFILPGYIPYRDVPKYISAMDICLAPLKKVWGETSSVKIFDCLSCARPVVTTKFGSTGNYLSKGNCVMLVPPEDQAELTKAITELLEDPHKMEEMGHNGRNFVLENHSRKSSAKHIDTIAKGI